MLDAGRHRTSTSVAAAWRRIARRERPAGTRTHRQDQHAAVLGKVSGRDLEEEVADKEQRAEQRRSSGTDPEVLLESPAASID